MSYKTNIENEEDIIEVHDLNDIADITDLNDMNEANDKCNYYTNNEIPEKKKLYTCFSGTECPACNGWTVRKYEAFLSENLS